MLSGHDAFVTRSTYKRSPVFTLEWLVDGDICGNLQEIAGNPCL